MRNINAKKIIIQLILSNTDQRILSINLHRIIILLNIIFAIRYRYLITDNKQWRDPQMRDHLQIRVLEDASGSNEFDVRTIGHKTFDYLFILIKFT